MLQILLFPCRWGRICKLIHEAICPCRLFPVHLGRCGALGQHGVLLVRLRILRLLAGHHQCLDPVFVDKVSTLVGANPSFIIGGVYMIGAVFDGLFDADLDFVIFARVDVPLRIHQMRLPRTPRKKAEIAELIRGMHLVLIVLLGDDSPGREQTLDRRRLNVHFFVVFVLVATLIRLDLVSCLLELICPFHHHLVTILIFFHQFFGR